MDTSTFPKKIKEAHVRPLLKNYLVTPITDIINISMDTSTFPKKIKEAHVRPLLKKNISS